MVFFDNEFLLQYLEQDTPIQVFVDSEYYDISDASDLQNPTFGVGYDLNGKPHVFDYRAIEQIKVAGKILPLDQLQNKIDGVEEPPAGGEPDSGGAPNEPGPAPGGGGDSDLDAALKNSGTNPPSGPASPDDEEEKEPPQESARRIFNNMITEQKKKQNTAASGYVKGDFVENIDLNCEFHGSRGVVTTVDMPKDKDGIASVEYRIFNYGYNFKPGQKVTKLANELSKIGNDG